MRSIFFDLGPWLLSYGIVVVLLSSACANECTRHSDCPLGECGASGRCTSIPSQEGPADADTPMDAMSPMAAVDASAIPDGAPADADITFDGGVPDAGIPDAGIPDALSLPTRIAEPPTNGPAAQ